VSNITRVEWTRRHVCYVGRARRGSRVARETSEVRSESGAVPQL
jgi:hypothetical protein